MTKLNITIGSIRHSLEVDDEEVDIFLKIIKSLNEKTNKLKMKAGKINDRLLLFILLLINTNKKTKIFNNFEENIIKLLKTSTTSLQSNDDLDSQLIISSIITENENGNMEEPIQISDDQSIQVEDSTYNEALEFIDNIIQNTEKLIEKINNL